MVGVFATAEASAVVRDFFMPLLDVALLFRSSMQRIVTTFIGDPRKGPQFGNNFFVISLFFAMTWQMVIDTVTVSTPQH